jgi:hypothetical protein
MLKLTILSLLVAVASCAEYGGPGTPSNVPEDAGPIDDGGVCPLPEECPEPEDCPEPEVCEVCEVCEECPEPPVSDPCSCFETCTSSFEVQKCLSDMMRAQGMCTNTPDQHYDFRLWCKIDGDWQSEKTWVYPCDELPWYERD